MRKPGTSWESKVYQQLRHVNRVTISAWNAAKSARIPISIAQRNFGIVTLEHALAIKWCIDNKKILPEDLENARNSGQRMNILIICPENPHKVNFVMLSELL